jgi:light-harvesting complex 1 beta chain
VQALPALFPTHRPVFPDGLQPSRRSAWETRPRGISAALDGGSNTMSDVTRRPISASGLTESEAKEFHSIFLTSFIAFTVVAIIAHFLVWEWRPWLPGPNGYTTSMLDGINLAKSFLA